MKKDFLIIKKDSPCEQTVVAGNYISLKRIYADNFLEIVAYHINQDCQVHLQPPIKADSIKTYLMLQGQIECFLTKEVINEGDMIVLRPESEWVAVSLEKGSSFLVHTYGESAYETTSNFFKAAYDVLEKIQKKDDYTNLHNQRVHDLTKKIGINLGFTGNRFRNLLYAARFHDVGKIYIPDHILNKPDKLSDDEYAIMKGHALYAKDLITEHIGFDVYNLMIQHHERLDGSGYPFGLTKDDISMEGKILGVIDTYDAMTTERIYKPGKSPQQAILELYELSEKYCTASTDALVNVLKDDNIL